MIHLSVAPKVGAIFLGSIFLVLLFIAADPSPYTPWILGALVPIGLFIAGMLVYSQRQRAKEQAETAKRLAILETQMTPFWATLQTKLADALHHPHPESKERDALLEKLEKLTITQDERARLRTLLAEIIENPAETVEEKAKAQLLLLAMPLVIAERHAIIADVNKIKAGDVIKSVVLPESVKAPIQVEIVKPIPKKPPE